MTTQIRLRQLRHQMRNSATKDARDRAAKEYSEVTTRKPRRSS